MPVRKVGEDCYQWGNQKVYCGKDAKRKAILQGIAIENTGWKEAEEINLAHVPNIGLVVPSQLGGVDSKRKLWLHKGHYLIGTTEDGYWGVYDLDRNDFCGWNGISFPLTKKYWKWYDSLGEKAKQNAQYWHLHSFEDAIVLADWNEEEQMNAAKKFHGGDDSMSTNFLSKVQRKALRMKMNREEREQSRHPNRSSHWIPHRLVIEKADEVRRELECPTCGGKMFGTIVAAKRHQFYCDKYGFQPPNGLYFSPISLHFSKRLHKDKNFESECTCKPCTFCEGRTGHL